MDQTANGCALPALCNARFDVLEEKLTASEEKIDALREQLGGLWKNGLASLDRRLTILEEQHKRTLEAYGQIATIEKEQSGQRTAMTQHGVTLRMILWAGGLLTATTVSLVGKALLDALGK